MVAAVGCDSVAIGLVVQERHAAAAGSLHGEPLQHDGPLAIAAAALSSECVAALKGRLAGRRSGKTFH